MFRHLSTDTDITQDKITYWFKVSGNKIGLRYTKGEESAVNHIGQQLKCLSSVFMTRIRQEKELIK